MTILERIKLLPIEHQLAIASLMATIAEKYVVAVEKGDALDVKYTQ